MNLGTWFLGPRGSTGAGRRWRRFNHPRRGSAVELGSLAAMRPVVMAGAAGGLSLLPAAISSGVGVQAQQPLTHAGVGVMVAIALVILLVIVLLAAYWLRKRSAPVTVKIAPHVKGEIEEGGFKGSDHT